MICRRSLILLLFLLLGGSHSDASERPTVVVPPPGQEIAEQLVGSLASACNKGDFISFMTHFTPSHGRVIRRRMENLFISHQPRMNVYRVTLLSEEDGKITFGVKYAWHDASASLEVIASRITARKVNGEWKLDGEKVQSQTRSSTDSAYAKDEGVVAVQPDVWDPFNPPAHLIDPSLEHLRGDVGILPGRGCANGQCGR